MTRLEYDHYFYTRLGVPDFPAIYSLENLEELVDILAKAPTLIRETYNEAYQIALRSTQPLTRALVCAINHCWLGEEYKQKVFFTSRYSGLLVVGDVQHWPVYDPEDPNILSLYSRESNLKFDVQRPGNGVIKDRVIGEEKSHPEKWEDTRNHSWFGEAGIKATYAFQKDGTYFSAYNLEYLIKRPD